MNRALLIMFLAFQISAPHVLGMSAASAQSDPTVGDDPCPPPNLRTNVRPSADGSATNVSVGVRILDLLKIDDIDQTLTIDFAMLRTWKDPRLAHLEGCEIPLADVWYPEVVIFNSGRLFEKWPREVSIGPDGNVKYIQRLSGTIASHHKLHEFPFDSQAIAVSFTPLKWSENEVKFSSDEKFSGMVENLNISDWIIESVKADVGRQHIAAFDQFHSRYDFTITAHRIRSYYVWKVILPLCLIVAMSWCVFWINPAEFGAQLGLSATAMLTMIAFIFATTNMVPALGYPTLLDMFIGGSTVLVFLALIESLYTSYLVSKNRSNLAMQIDRLCRVLFPASYAAIAVVVFIL